MHIGYRGYIGYLKFFRKSFKLYKTSKGFQTTLASPSMSIMVFESMVGCVVGIVFGRGADEKIETVILLYRYKM